MVGDGGRDAGLYAAQSHAVVALQQAVPDDLVYPCLGIHTQSGEVDAYRVAQIDLLQMRHVLIPRGLRQQRELYVPTHDRNADLIALDIRRASRLQLRLGGPLLKVGGQIQRHELGVAEVALRIHRRSHNGGFIILPVRDYARIAVGAVRILRQVGKVLSVPDGYAAIGAAARQQTHRPAVKLIFAAVYIQQAALLTTQQRPRAGWHRYCHRCHRGFVGAQLKRHARR